MKRYFSFFTLLFCIYFCFSSASLAQSIEETGIATVDTAMVKNQAQARVVALRTARQLAYQQLADRLTGLLAAADAETRAAIAGDSAIQAFSEGYVRGASVKPDSETTEILEDGSTIGSITLILDLPAKLISSAQSAPETITPTPTPSSHSSTPLPTQTPQPEPTISPPSDADTTQISTVAIEQMAPPSLPSPSEEPNTSTPEAVMSPTPPDHLESATEKPTTPTPSDNVSAKTSPESPPPTDSANGSPSPPETQKSRSSAELDAHTGLIVDTRNTSFTPHDFPALLSASGLLLYGVNPENIRVAYIHGYVHYVTDMSDPDVERYAGDRPLVVIASTTVKGHAGDNLVVSDDDAEKIRIADINGKFFCKCRVVMIVSEYEEDKQ